MSILQIARAKARLDNSDLISVIYNSPSHFQSLKDYIAKIKAYHPQEEMMSIYEKSRVDKIKYAYKAAAQAIREHRENYITKDVPHELFHATNFTMPGGISTIMVIPIINILANEQQKKQWLPLLNSFRAIGAYAQTELAHGSDVQSLQTEAIYDERKDVFVLNNPSVGSYKWWPGELGHIGNVAVVYAKTIVKGKNIGVLPFMVKIRDLQTHKVCKGVNVGDVGPKFGYAAKENGYLWFDNYEIPRNSLLNKFFDIDKTGKLITKGNPKIMYGAMMTVRIFLIHSSGYTLGKGLAIALRYSHLRKQFKNDKGEETTVIDYQLQQHKLFPLLAKAHAMILNHKRISNAINECNSRIEKGDFSLLQECHILLSGAKAMYTWWTNSGLTVCMQCCGGHGFSQYSGIPFLIQSFSPNCILEGENTILLLQVGRFLLKHMGNIIRGKTKKVKGHVSYLLEGDMLEEFKAVNSSSFVNNPSNLLTLMRKACYLAVGDTLQHMAENTKDNNFLETFNKKSGVRVFECAKLHTVMFTLETFINSQNDLNKKNVKDVYTDLSLLFAIDQILEFCHLFIAFDVFDGEFIELLKTTYESVLERLKNDALVLSEIFVPDDYILFSAIANSNEKPYENLYKLAKETGMSNQVDLSGFYLNTIRKASLKAFPKL